MIALEYRRLSKLNPYANNPRKNAGAVDAVAASIKEFGFLECVSKIPEYAISGGAVPFLRHKARLSAAKPSDLFLELTENPLELADCSA